MQQSWKWYTSIHQPPLPLFSFVISHYQLKWVGNWVRISNAKAFGIVSRDKTSENAKLKCHATTMLWLSVRPGTWQLCWHSIFACPHSNPVPPNDPKRHCGIDSDPAPAHFGDGQLWTSWTGWYCGQYMVGSMVANVVGGVVSMWLVAWLLMWLVAWLLMWSVAWLLMWSVLWSVCGW